jgi:hypothetical protein
MLLYILQCSAKLCEQYTILDYPIIVCSVCSIDIVKFKLDKKGQRYLAERRSFICSKTEQNMVWMGLDLAWVSMRWREASWSSWYVEHQNRFGNNQVVVKMFPFSLNTKFN